MANHEAKLQWRTLLSTRRRNEMSRFTEPADYLVKNLAIANAPSATASAFLNGKNRSYVHDPSLRQYLSGIRRMGGDAWSSAPRQVQATKAPSGPFWGFQKTPCSD